MASAELELSGGTATTDQVSSRPHAFAAHGHLRRSPLPTIVPRAALTVPLLKVARFGPVRPASRPQRAPSQNAPKRPLRVPGTTIPVSEQEASVVHSRPGGLVRAIPEGRSLFSGGRLTAGVRNLNSGAAAGLASQQLESGGFGQQRGKPRITRFDDANQRICPYWTFSVDGTRLASGRTVGPARCRGPSATRSVERSLSVPGCPRPDPGEDAHPGRLPV